MRFLNGETIRELVDMLPPHVFDEVVYNFPDLLEMEAWKCEYVHWYNFDADYGPKDVYDYWE